MGRTQRRPGIFSEPRSNRQWDKLSNEDMDFIQEQFRLVPRKLTGPRGNGWTPLVASALGFSNANDCCSS